MGYRERVNHWKTLQYHDPAEILRRLRALEFELQNVELDPKVRSLRTTRLNQIREWREAAVFAYGMGQAQGVDVGYAREEASDYDFVTTWKKAGAVHFCPVQLKELVPEELNRNATLAGLFSGLGKYSKTDTVLAVKINRKVDVVLPEKPIIPFSQLWLFWASAPASSRWCLYGDALREPGYFAFDYPEGPPLTHWTPEGWSL
jgi:hypothetical protein